MRPAWQLRARLIKMQATPVLGVPEAAYYKSIVIETLKWVLKEDKPHRGVEGEG